MGFIFFNDLKYKFGGEINEIGGFADMILNTGGYAINHFFVFLVLSFYGIKLFFNKSSLKRFLFFRSSRNYFRNSIFLYQIGPSKFLI